MEEKDRLLEQATKCRRIASSINDPESVARLKAPADEYERLAAARRTGKATGKARCGAPDPSTRAPHSGPPHPRRGTSHTQAVNRNDRSAITERSPECLGVRAPQPSQHLSALVPV
jgi:hypothetical protein